MERAGRYDDCSFLTKGSKIREEEEEEEVREEAVEGEEKQRIKEKTNLKCHGQRGFSRIRCKLNGARRAANGQSV